MSTYPSKMSRKEILWYKSIVTNIKFYRVASSMNQETLAKKIKLSRTSLVNIEMGRQRPSLYVLKRIADALNIELLSLIMEN